jgi:hypothetical protein
MKKVTIEVYEYDELSPEAQTKARDWFRAADEGDAFYAESVYEDAAEIAGHLGITIEKSERRSRYHIFWSGFSSQGDGACFEGSWSAANVNAKALIEYAPQDVELHRIVKGFAEVAAAFPQASFTVKQSGHYNHEHCTEFAFEFEASETELARRGGFDQRQPEDDAEDRLRTAAKDFMRWIYKQLETAYNYEQEDETVAENIRANEYGFTVDGKRSTVL